MNKTRVFIPITKGQVLIIDHDDYELVKQYKWYATTNCSVYYARTKKHINGKIARILLHRLITNCPRDMQIDHIDGNGLNNCRDNLRVCTHSQNQHNKKKMKRNTSGYKGVFFNKRDSNWKSMIMVNKKSVFLGYFSNPEDAYKAYCEAAEKYHGEFKNLD